MRVRTMLVPVLILAASTPMAAQQEVPAPLKGLKPHQIVEAVAAERQSLELTDVQVSRLDSLHLAVRKEPHRYEPSPSQKAHQNVRMKPMISKQRAYADALAILTPEQRGRAATRFADPEYRLPEEFQRQAAGTDSTRPGDPLQRHGAGAAPTGQAAGDTSVGDPLQHRGGAGVPPEQAADSDKPAPKPLEHQ